MPPSYTPYASLLFTDILSAIYHSWDEDLVFNFFLSYKSTISSPYIFLHFTVTKDREARDLIISVYPYFIYYQRKRSAVAPCRSYPLCTRRWSVGLPTARYSTGETPLALGDSGH